MSSTAGPLAGSSSAAASMRGARPEGCPTRSARRQRTAAAKVVRHSVPGSNARIGTSSSSMPGEGDPDEVTTLKLARHLLKEGTPGTGHTACESTWEPDLQTFFSLSTADESLCLANYVTCRHGCSVAAKLRFPLPSRLRTRVSYPGRATSALSARPTLYRTKGPKVGAHTLPTHGTGPSSLVAHTR